MALIVYTLPWCKTNHIYVVLTSCLRFVGKLNAAAKSRAEEERSSSTQNSTKSSNIDLPETSCPDRLVLGLSANGPLNLQELKTA